MISSKTMVDTYNLLNHSNYLENVSCLAVMDFHFSNRCEMARRIDHCRFITNFFNYFVMMYCAFKIDNKITEVVVMLLFGLIYCVFLCVLYLGINYYFLPTLKIAALRLRINEYMAGVLLVGVANSTPDLLVNLSPVRHESLTFNIAMANALTIICLSGGMVCFIRPFRMNGHSVFRDLLFLLLTVELVRLFIKIKSITALLKGILVLSIYPIYLLINVVDLFLHRFTIKQLRMEIEILRHSPSSLKHDNRLTEKIILLNNLEEDDDIQFRESKIFRQGSFHAGFFVTPKLLIRHREVDVEANRTMLHNKANPKNLFLISEFIHSINPIDSEAWYLNGKWGRFIYIAKAPVSFMLQLLIPFVDYQKVKHGWSKLLNCIQIVINPFVTLTLVETMLDDKYYDWYNLLQFNLAMWSLMAFCMLTIFTVIIFCWICAWEMDALISIIGIVFDLSPSFMSITFNTVSAAMADFISYEHLAQHGYGKMAFGAVVGGSVFNMVLNVGIEFVMQKKVDSHGQVILFGNEGETIYIFLVLTITTTMWWCLTFNFLARRSAGVFLWCIFILFFVYSTAIEFEWVHGFEDNPHINPVGE
ncbi:mitochondrial sodium/calcium exchanger protein [Drosophila gunungcola]|uniref:mitochondrial sodium/calcium exchanger protein n=1 Tax=Drosophila gunungcola TaxID=103775 RepID=UPI0022E0837B|nr:mitochondrial sodium/calcium exchanger protein [Drosophila gunungcola]